MNLWCQAAKKMTGGAELPCGEGKWEVQLPTAPSPGWCVELPLQIWGQADPAGNP